LHARAKELFPEIQALLSTVDVTPAEVSEILLRSEDVDVMLRGLKEFLQEKRRKTRKEAGYKKDAAEDYHDHQLIPCTRKIFVSS
jgi:pyoverdine/dityrosine biosynthesis protein Dit1